MDYTGREGTKETLEGEDSCRSNLKGTKAHVRSAETKGAPSRNFDRSPPASEEANSPGLKLPVLAFRKEPLADAYAKQVSFAGVDPTT